jgi:hypothetical protein
MNSLLNLLWRIFVELCCLLEAFGFAAGIVVAIGLFSDLDFSSKVNLYAGLCIGISIYTKKRFWS